VTKTIRIGTRGSRLALWQAERTRDVLQGLDAEIVGEIVPIQSRGDEPGTARISDLGEVGIFTRAIERALLEEQVDVAVHSLKDLPTESPPGLELAALLPRDDPRDALIAATLAGYEDAPARVALSALPRAARVGTSSLRRQAQLLRARRDLQVVELRGNVPTRLAKVEAGELDGILLSSSGLDRLGLRPVGCIRLDPDLMLPAPAQGTIAVQVRAGDAAMRALLRRADDARTRLVTTTERLLLHELEGGCRVPLGALAQLEDGTLRLQARLLSADGQQVVESAGSGPAGDFTGLAHRVAAELFGRGAGSILAALRAAPS
jgi:hydroxymethylbilane synthase